MTRWMMKFEVEAFNGLEDDKSSLTFVHPNHDYEIVIRNQDMKVSSGKPLILVFISFSCDNINEGEELGAKYLRHFLDVLGFTTNMRYQIHKKISIFDWTKGVQKRQGRIFTYLSDPDFPVLFLNKDAIETVEILLQASSTEIFENALARFRIGVSSRDPDSQFQWFWFVIEMLASHLVDNKTKVPDLCCRCREPLFCPKCKEISNHRPYPKQSIERLFKENVTGDYISLFVSSSAMRNALLHGDDTDEIEKKYDISLHQLVDSVGSLAWVCLYNALLNNIPKSVNQVKLQFTKPDSYLYKNLESSATVEIELVDNEDLSIEKYPSINFTIVPGEETHPLT